MWGSVLLAVCDFTLHVTPHRLREGCVGSVPAAAAACEDACCWSRVIMQLSGFALFDCTLRKSAKYGRVALLLLCSFVLLCFCRCSHSYSAPPDTGRIFHLARVLALEMVTSIRLLDAWLAHASVQAAEPWHFILTSTAPRGWSLLTLAVPVMLTFSFYKIS